MVSSVCKAIFEGEIESIGATRIEKYFREVVRYKGKEIEGRKERIGIE